MIAGGYLKICCVESRKTCSGKNTALFTLALVRNLSGRSFSVKNEPKITASLNFGSDFHTLAGVWAFTDLPPQGDKRS